MWIRIVAPNFVAGAEVRGGIIIETAPIIRGWRGRLLWRLKVHCQRKGWVLEEHVDEQIAGDAGFPHGKGSDEGA